MNAPRSQVKSWLMAYLSFLPPLNSSGKNHRLTKHLPCPPRAAEMQHRSIASLAKESLCDMPLTRALKDSSAGPEYSGIRFQTADYKKVLEWFCYGSFSKAFVFCTNGAFLRPEPAPPPRKKRKKKKKGKVRPSLCTDEIPERAGFIVQLKCCICLTKTRPLLPAFCTGPRSLRWIATNGRCCKRARSP